MSDESYKPGEVIHGAALRAAVVAAEAPVTGELFKRAFMIQLKMGELMELDMRDLGDPQPLARPIHLPRAARVVTAASEEE